MTSVAHLRWTKIRTRPWSRYPWIEFFFFYPIIPSWACSPAHAHTKECSSLPSNYCQWPGGHRRRSVLFALLQHFFFLLRDSWFVDIRVASCWLSLFQIITKKVCILRSTVQSMQVLVLHSGRKRDRRGGCTLRLLTNDSFLSLCSPYGVYCTVLRRTRGCLPPAPLLPPLHDPFNTRSCFFPLGMVFIPNYMQAIVSTPTTTSGRGARDYYETIYLKTTKGGREKKWKKEIKIRNSKLYYLVIPQQTHSGYGTVWRSSLLCWVPGGLEALWLLLFQQAPKATPYRTVASVPCSLNGDKNHLHLRSARVKIKSIGC